MLANLSVDRGSQEAIVTDADLVIHTLLDVLSCAVTVHSHTSPHKPSSLEATIRSSTLNCLYDNISRLDGPTPSNAASHELSEALAAATASRGAAASNGVTALSGSGNLPEERGGGLYGNGKGTGGSSEVVSPSQVSTSSYTTRSGRLQLQDVDAAAGVAAAEGSAVERTGEDLAAATQLHCFVAIALSNAMAHPVLARAALTHARTVPLLCALVMRVPSPT